MDLSQKQPELESEVTDSLLVSLLVVSTSFSLSSFLTVTTRAPIEALQCISIILDELREKREK
jgi:hypothetical protein